MITASSDAERLEALRSHEPKSQLLPHDYARWGISFYSATALFATEVWAEAAALERQRQFPVLTRENWGTAWSLQEARLTVLLLEIGLAR